MPLWEHLEPIIPRLYRFALRLTNHSDRAEDLTQETLLRAWEKREGLRDHESARVWLFRIAVNLWRDQLRRNQRRPDWESGVESAADPAREPELVAIDREEVREALKALDRLPPRQREVLHLAAVEELSLAEIAEVLGISRNAAKVHLCEARKKMRQMLYPSNNPTPPTKQP